MVHRRGSSWESREGSRRFQVIERDVYVYTMVFSIRWFKLLLFMCGYSGQQHCVKDGSSNFVLK